MFIVCKKKILILYLAAKSKENKLFSNMTSFTQTKRVNFEI